MVITIAYALIALVNVFWLCLVIKLCIDNNDLLNRIVIKDKILEIIEKDRDFYKNLCNKLK